MNPNHISRGATLQPSALNGQATGSAKPTKFPRITMAELASGDYSVRFHVAGVLAERQPCIIAGNEKTLKTTISVDLAVSIATGTPFLGQFETVGPTNVGVMSGESGLATLQETALRICAAKEIDPHSMRSLVWSDRLPNFESAADQDGLREFLVEDELGVLIIDPAYLCMDPDGRENSMFAMGAMLKPVANLCQEMGVTLCIVHHNKTQGRGLAGRGELEPAELQDIAWAGFKQFARQWILLARRERYEPGSGNHKLWMTVGGSVGHGSLAAIDVDEGRFPSRVWRVSVTGAAKARAAAQEASDKTKRRELESVIEADKRQIVEAVVALPAADTKTAIRSRTTLNGERFNRAFVRLLTDKTLHQWPAVRKDNGRPYDAFWHQPAPATATDPAVEQKTKRARKTTRRGKKTEQRDSTGLNGTGESCPVVQQTQSTQQDYPT